MRWRFQVAIALCSLLVAFDAASAAGFPGRRPTKTPAQLRAEYLARVSRGPGAEAKRPSMGSLWSADAAMTDPSSDYKAHSLNDVVTVLASVATTAAQTGNVTSGRDFSTNSAISGMAGAFSTKGTNPLITAQSSTSLKGSGATDSSTTLTTSLSGQVIAVLRNGNLAIEAHRAVDMNHQHEEIIVRGIARQGDISPANTIASSSLSDLEIELRGKGIISDSVRPPNPLTRAVLWLFGF